MQPLIPAVIRLVGKAPATPEVVLQLNGPIVFDESGFSQSLLELP